MRFFDCLALVGAAGLLTACGNGTGGSGGIPVGCHAAEQSCQTSADCCGGFVCQANVCVSAVASASSGGSGSAGSGSGTTGSSGSSSSAATSSSSSSGASSSSSSSSSSGGCASVDSSEFGQCDGGVVCGPGLSCVADPSLSYPACEYPCNATSDCPDRVAVCSGSGGHCTPDFCGPGPLYGEAAGTVVNGPLDGVCNAAGTGDGTCVPVPTNFDGRIAYGLCVQGGSATSSCNPSALPPRCAPASVCGAGDLCDPASSQCVAAFQEAAHSPYPYVPYNGGPVIAHPGLVAISFQNDAYVADEQGWAKWVVGSFWLQDVGVDYGVGAGTFVDGVVINSAAPTSLPDETLQEEASQLFGSGALTPSDSDIYLFFVPAGSSVIGAGGTPSCANGGFLGYHSMFQSAGTSIAYGVVVDCGSGWGYPDPASIEITAGHELIEAATDPFSLPPTQFTLDNGITAEPGLAWALPDWFNPWWSLESRAEVGDLCVGTAYQDPDAGYWAQRIWSNSAAASAFTSPCAPVPPNEAFYSATGYSNTVPVEPGETVSFSISGWSTPAQSGGWCASAQAAGLTLTFGSTGTASAQMDNGSTDTLNATVPATTTLPALSDAGFGIEFGDIMLVSSDCQSSGLPLVSDWPERLVVISCAPPTAAGQVDPCAQAGLVCTAVAAGSVCLPPGEFGGCTPFFGCQSPAQCVADAGVCLLQCQQTASCDNTFSNCQPYQGQSFCLPASCGPGTSNGTSYFGACDNAGTSDGTCVPIAAGTGGVETACLAGGTLPAGSACTPGRSPGNALCAPGTFCVGSSATGYACTALCSTGAVSGPSCATGSVCVPVQSDGAYGVCLESCTGTGVCPVGYACDEVSASEAVCVP